ncbi:MMPL family transporter [Kocuria tytonis]|uniref:Steryl acetyl hydrolase n=1 Tax=Kocuria tytonis TaxID=2054280 RepID=A0A495A7H1_9MICC|nr:MMPL family transporter [Kocuria tytonis]RKQ35292.1 steryl acetyl hydrolase [Kocuria tytonis]
MARLLYRLGKSAAAHAWAVILVWVAVLALAVGGVALSGVNLSNAITIPGTETQNLADRLKAEMPEANQGTGRVVFYTQDGSEFTQAQKDGVADAIKATEDVSGVDSTVDPFERQQQLDDGHQKLKDGRAQLDKGEQQIAQLKKSLPPGVSADQVLKQRGMDPARLEQQKAQLEEGEKTYDRMGDYRVVSKDDNSAISVVNFTDEQNAVEAETKNAVMDAVRSHPVDGVSAEFSQEIAQDVSSLVGPAEIVGVITAALVLLIMLRALVPAFLPVLTALLGVAIAACTTLAFSGVIDMMSVTPMLGVMLGLAVGIDYSLFVLNRHRQQLRQGMSVRESIGMAAGTSGTAVFFAALTVIVALVALNVSGVPFLGLMGTAGGLAVAVALLMTLTLTPALLSLAGKRVLPKKVRNAAPREDHIDPHDVPLHLRHPWITALASVAVLVVLALPAQSMRLGLPDSSTEARDSTQYKAYQRIAHDFGAGENGPIAVVVDLPEGLDKAQAKDTMDEVADRLADQEDVANVLQGNTTDDRTTGVIQVIPKSGPAEAATEQLVGDIRGLNEDLKTDEDVHVGVAGTTAANIDVSQLLGEKLPLYLGVVLIISLLLLLMVFRSILVPVIATVGFLLSVLASFGAVVAVYQWGWGGALFGVHDPGPILSFLPTLMVGILFGLAMDYQLFLVSGMREAYVHGHPARQAVVYGFKAGRSVVTAAAIIMISVFAGFIFADLAMIRPIGFALAGGVLLDAFVVRMLLIPAVMRLLGEKAWWIPRWLDRILPHVDVEGESLARERAGSAGAVADSPEDDDAARRARRAGRHRADSGRRRSVSGRHSGTAALAAAGATAAGATAAARPEGGTGTRETPESEDRHGDRVAADHPAHAEHRAASEHRRETGDAEHAERVARRHGRHAADTEARVRRHREAEVTAEVVVETADRRLRLTNEALRAMPNVMESESKLLSSLAAGREEAAPHKSMHERVFFEKVMVAGRPVVIARPKRALERMDAPVVIHWHGGAYVHPMTVVHWRWIDALIQRTGATVVVPGYGLAPDHTVDEALQLADGVWDLVRGMASRIFLSGDSAGGGLALAQAMRLRDADASDVAGLILISPWVDATVSNPQIEAYRDVDHMLDTEGPRAAGRWWAGARAVTDPVVSPAFGDVRGLPRTFVLQGDRDMLYPDTMEFVAELMRAHVDVTTVVCEGGPHVYALMVWSARVTEDLDRVVRWMDR